MMVLFPHDRLAEVLRKRLDKSNCAKLVALHSRRRKGLNMCQNILFQFLIRIIFKNPINIF